MKLSVNLPHSSYDIVIERYALGKLSQFVDLNRKVLIITDDGVPEEHVQVVKDQCPQGIVSTVPQGESSKSLKIFEQLLETLLSHHFTRSDLVIGVGGGVIGDLAGFVAASYMRGIAFVNCPTTTLSQLDSSIGGKVAINLKDTKNMVGAFYQPSFVLIDPDTLTTLSPRHFSAGLAEAVKAGMIADPSLFLLFETGNIEENLEEILYKSLMMKKTFVEADEKETGIRAALNFGHTIGHGIESYGKLGALYHGECVALGMLCMTENPELKQRLLAIYNTLQLPTTIEYDGNAVYQAMLHDKKAKGSTTKVVKVAELGSYRLDVVETTSLREIIGEGIS